jgi:hypothetical protein
MSLIVIESRVQKPDPTVQNCLIVILEVEDVARFMLGNDAHVGPRTEFDDYMHLRPDQPFDGKFGAWTKVQSATSFCAAFFLWLVLCRL